MPTLQEVLKHPGYAGLPDAEKIKALDEVDEGFRGLPPEEKAKFVRMPLAPKPDLRINPNASGPIASAARFASGVNRTLISPMTHAVGAAAESIAEDPMRALPLSPQGIAARGRGLAALFKGAQEASHGQFQKGFEQYDKGGLDYRGPDDAGLSATGRFITGSVPLVGPAAGEEVNRLFEGDVAGGGGGIAGLLAPLYLANKFRRAPQAPAPSGPPASSVTAPRPAAPPPAPVAAPAPTPQSAMQTQITDAFNPSRRQFLKMGGAAAVGAAAPKAVGKAAGAMDAPLPAATAGLDPVNTNLARMLQADMISADGAVATMEAWMRGDKTVTASAARRAHALWEELGPSIEANANMLEEFVGTSPDIAPLLNNAREIAEVGASAMDPLWIKKGKLSRRRVASKTAEQPTPQAEANAQVQSPEQVAAPKPTQNPPAAPPEAPSPATASAGPPKRSERPPSTPEEQAIADRANERIARESLAAEMKKPNPDPVVIEDLRSKIEFYGDKTRQSPGPTPSPVPVQPQAPAKGKAWTGTFDSNPKTGRFRRHFEGKDPEEFNPTTGQWEPSPDAAPKVTPKVVSGQAKIGTPPQVKTAPEQRIASVLETAKAAGVGAKDLLERFMHAGNVARVAGKAVATGSVGPGAAMSAARSMAVLASKPWGATILKKWLKAAPGSAQQQFWLARLGEAKKKEEERAKREARPSPKP